MMYWFEQLTNDSFLNKGSREDWLITFCKSLYKGHTSYAALALFCRNHRMGNISEVAQTIKQFALSFESLEVYQMMDSEPDWKNMQSENIFFLIENINEYEDATAIYLAVKETLHDLLHLISETLRVKALPQEIHSLFTLYHREIEKEKNKLASSWSPSDDQLEAAKKLKALLDAL